LLLSWRLLVSPWSQPGLQEQLLYKYWNPDTKHLGRTPRQHMDPEEIVPDFFNIQETTICPDCSGDNSS